MVTQPPWVTSTILHSEQHPSTHTSAHTFRPLKFTYHITNRAQQTQASAQPQLASLSQGAKIGIIIGVVVIGILSIVGCGLGFLSFRKHRKRRKQRKLDRDSELHTLETEIRSGQAGHKRNRESGLWDNLKIRAMDEEERDSTAGNAEGRGVGGAMAATNAQVPTMNSQEQKEERERRV
jgi:hypothetical protein